MMNTKSKIGIIILVIGIIFIIGYTIHTQPSIPEKPVILNQSKVSIPLYRYYSDYKETGVAAIVQQECDPISLSDNAPYFVKVSRELTKEEINELKSKDIIFDNYFDYSSSYVGRFSISRLPEVTQLEFVMYIEPGWGCPILEDIGE